LSKKIISYWLDSLVMADQLQDSSRFTGSSALPIARSSLATGQLDDLDHSQIRQILASKVSVDAQGKSRKPSNRVLAFPFVLKRHPADQQPLIPLWIPALIINDRGMLAPDPEYQPWIPRQLLNPAVSNAIGDIEQFDRFFLDNDCPTDWPNYWKFCGQLLERVTGQTWEGFQIQDYQTLDRGLILPNTAIVGASMHIQALYRQILDLSTLPPLLKRYASLRDRHLQDILTPTAQRPYEAQHLGQMGDRYPLSPSQREALHHFFSLDQGEILAINGPPGTGKTTLLQSVIASLWIRQALQQALPPIILASSTNNQAVTNIIVSFQQHESDLPFEQRWLPRITSHGLYLSASSKTEEAIKAGLQAVAPGRKGLITEIEDPKYRQQAHQYFLTQFNNHTDLGVTKISSALGWLHQQLKQIVAEIQALTKPAAELDLLRYQAFWLATHYWEARWLLDMANCKPAKFVSYNYTVRDWQRLAMLAPCFVATFHMAPRFFQFNREARWGFIDLLIVDEAGQVSPEIAGATFALAQQSLVVGDVQQIEPVWAVTDNVNTVNLHHHKLVKKMEERNLFEATGLSAASGSVMQIAQRSSCYQKYPEQRGLLLTEHRRCLPEIISYCNDLCYGGYLEPKRDSLATDLMPKLRDGFSLPPLGYLFIPGQSEQSNGSRRNPPEAQRIAQWLLEQSGVLISYYQRPLSEIVAILSPFAAQKHLLAKALHTLEIRDLTVGTVHALQGAEKPIVIFSPVYDSNAGQTFFLDRKPNMLNVAVSRAKDSFLVFGDLRVFNPSHQTPSGLLGRHLFNRPENALPQY
jgi:energy-coupling factor transporter ATP-binding protein EcfA2